MITEEENNLLTKTGKGTPCGELMRRYWQPAALSDELTADKPMPVTLFGEEMVLFRDGAGAPALIGRYCAHQGVDMIYGRVEPDGLRCMYHGWLFDPCGKVVLRGEWLPEKERRWDVGQPAYPCIEVSGVIFTYMGPGDPPVLADELAVKFATACGVTKALRQENYITSITHGPESLADAGFVLPNLLASQAALSNAEHRLRWQVAVDDSSHVEFTLRYVGESLISGEVALLPHQQLLGAIEKIRAERPMPSGKSAKD